MTAAQIEFQCHWYLPGAGYGYGGWFAFQQKGAGGSADEF